MAACGSHQHSKAHAGMPAPTVSPVPGTHFTVRILAFLTPPFYPKLPPAPGFPPPSILLRTQLFSPSAPTLLSVSRYLTISSYFRSGSPSSLALAMSGLLAMFSLLFFFFILDSFRCLCCSLSHIYNKNLNCLTEWSHLQFLRCAP